MNSIIFLIFTLLLSASALHSLALRKNVPFKVHGTDAQTKMNCNYADQKQAAKSGLDIEKNVTVIALTGIHKL